MKIQNSKLKTQNYFVVGTDTGVGKTVVTALLTLHFQARGANAGAMKPFASGCHVENGTLVSEDAEFLKNACALEETLEEINPARWEEPLTPLVAAQRANDESDYWTRALEAFGVLRARRETLIVEGVGGLLAPIAERDGKILTNSDWASTLGLPVILVARRGLGTINHTLLTIEVLRARKIEIAGLVFCDAEETAKNDVAAQTSPALISEISGLEIWGEVPYLRDLSRESLQNAAREFFQTRI